MPEFSWKTAVQCQQKLCLLCLFDEDVRKQHIHMARMYESCTQTWQGRTKAPFVTTRLFTQIFAEEKDTFSYSVF